MLISHLTTFPGLTDANFTKHFPESDETQEDHMKQTKQCTSFTKPKDDNLNLIFVRV